VLRELRQLDEVIDCTDLTQMATRDLYNEKVLSGVLAQDAHVAFGRILTLELLARAMRRSVSIRTRNLGIGQPTPHKVRKVPVAAEVSA